jgi:protein TonB
MTTQEAVANNPPRTPTPSRDAPSAPNRDIASGDGYAGRAPDLGIDISPPKKTFRSRRPQKTAWADLKAQYNIALLVGFALALGLMITLFSMDFAIDDSAELATIEQQEVVAMQDIQQTEQMERAPLPPRPPVPVEVPNDFIVEDEPLNLDASLDLNESLIVSDAPPPPAGPQDDGAAADHSDEIFIVVEEKPTLIGGRDAIYDKIRYPMTARQAGVQGRVIVQFVVDEDGNVTNPRALRSPHTMLSEEALRVIQLVKFTPGRQRNQRVKVQMALPIMFRLETR